MAPLLGRLHQLVARNVNLLRLALKQARQAATEKQQHAQLQPIPIYASKPRPIHPIAALKQSRSANRTAIRWFSSSSINAAVRRFTTSSAAPRGYLRYDRTKFPTSRIATEISRLPGRAPFASTLRPNLTGGALNRTAGGYTLGTGRIGGARHFSHAPCAPSQVVHNVSLAVRSFYTSGQKAQYAGTDPATGAKRYRAVSTQHDTTTRKLRAAIPRATPGSYVAFSVNPSITALTLTSSLPGFPPSSTTSLSQNETQNLNTPTLLTALSTDFSRALKDLAAILADLQLLSTLGDLPITYHDSGKETALRVHFPGVDARSVDTLLSDLNVKRGVVVQDEAFDSFAGVEMALLFPFAPVSAASGGDVDSQGELSAAYEYDFRYDDGRHARQLQTRKHLQDDASSTRSETSDLPLSPEDPFEHVALAPDEDASSLRSPSGSAADNRSANDAYQENEDSPLEYRDFEGICRFIELCDGHSGAALGGAGATSRRVG